MEGKKLANIRIPEEVKGNLDEIGRYLAERKHKKGVAYGEVVSFLIEQFELTKCENRDFERTIGKEKNSK
jgi:hypothetical protein